jgi:cellobiose phosphorylase
MVRVVTVVQQIMTVLSGAVSEEDTIVAMAEIVLHLMKNNGH